MTFHYIIAFLMPFILSYFLTPLAKKLAYKFGAIDVPKDNRRVHKEPIPRLGGLAIYLSTIITLLIIAPKTPTMLTIVAGGSIIAISGMIDDIKPMSAKLKLVFQILAAIVVVVGGTKIHFVTVPISNTIIDLKLFVIPITIFWIVGITNTLNLIDGLDGLSAGVSGISSLSFFFIAMNMAQRLDDPKLMALPILMSLVVAGSAFGFLPHNFNPARIFMGDTGSLFLGFMLSVIAVEGAMKSIAAILIPLLVLGLPIFDTTFAIVRRFVNKKPIMEADRGHLHHRLLDKGLTQKQTVLVLYTMSLLLGVSGILFSHLAIGIGLLVLAIVTALLLNTARIGTKTNEKKHMDR